MSGTEVAYLKKRIRNLQIALDAADRLVQSLMLEIDMTESAGAAFALDLAQRYPEAADELTKTWEEALRGI